MIVVMYLKSTLYGCCNNSCRVNRREVDPGVKSVGQDPQICVIHFTNSNNFSIETNCYTYIVYLSSDTIHSGKFYYFLISNTCPYGHLLPCDMVPDGPLYIVCSLHLISFNRYVELLSENDKIKAKRAVHNYKQDCDTLATYQISYEQHMDKIIEKLLQQTDTEIKNDIRCTIPESDRVVTVSAKEKIPEGNNIPDYFEVQTGCQNVKNTNDFNFQNKTRGFLSLGPTKFKFIGPDRDLCSFSNIEEVLHPASVIQATGLPNYKLARFPIKSGLNLPAWKSIYNTILMRGYFNI